MKWRFIEEEPYNAAMNMAIDHAIYESVANGRELPTIRFYKWKNNSISIGAYQNFKEINLEACRKFNVQTVRRMTGGRAVFHDKRDFTYSVIAPLKVFRFSIEEAYREICLWIVGALEEIGIKAELENKNDVMVKGRKISGNAAKAMDKGVYLQHGTLVYDIDYDIMPLALNISKDVIDEKMTSVLNIKQIRYEEALKSLKRNFLLGKEFEVGSVSDYEKIRAEKLAETNYSSIILPHGSFMRNKGACYVERGG